MHRLRRLHEEDHAFFEGIPVTSVARTLLDLAGLVLPRQFERAVEQAERLGHLDVRALERLDARGQGHGGRRLLRAALENYREPALTRSELERRFLDLCRDVGLPAPSINSFVAGVEVDVAWHDRRLVVELDGHEFHRTRAAFERDRVRDGVLQLAGYRVLRVTHRRLETEPVEVIATVRSLLTMGPDDEAMGYPPSSVSWHAEAPRAKLVQGRDPG